MKLTPKQKAFAEHYIKTGNATQSAISAGYSKKTAGETGHDNLKKPHILAYIDKHLNPLENKRIMDATEAMELLTSMARGEIVDSVVVSGGWGYKVIEKPADLNQRRDAVKEILKRFPMNKQDRLRDELLEQQIKKIQKELETETTTEDKLKEYFEMLGGAINGG